MRIQVRVEAELELEASLRWYAEHSSLRTEFIQAIDESMFAIAEGPHRYPLWRPGSRFRKFVVPRFPYVVIYRLHKDYVEIIAFAHTRRRPGYWTDRG